MQVFQNPNNFLSSLFNCRFSIWNVLQNCKIFQLSLLYQNRYSMSIYFRTYVLILFKIYQPPLLMVGFLKLYYSLFLSISSKTTSICLIHLLYAYVCLVLKAIIAFITPITNTEKAPKLITNILL